MQSKNLAAVALGSIKSKKKAAASRRNSKKGGRPREKSQGFGQNYDSSYHVGDLLGHKGLNEACDY